MATPDHVPFLRQRFAAAVLRLRPRTVLDFGCGGGAVLELLAGRGVEGTGVEADEGCREQVARLGLPVHAPGDPPESLPFADGSFDLVGLRHVAHHLADPARALLESLRVARRGIVVAEPWFDRSLPCQRVALDADLWLKTLHRRQGRVHGPNLDAGALQALGGKVPGLSFMVEHVRGHLAADREALEEEARGLLEEVGDDGMAARWQVLQRRMAVAGVSRNGSVIVTVAREGACPPFTAARS